MNVLRVLTVCTGNVCRSPAAAVMLERAIAEAGLSEAIEVGSAGTSWEAAGSPMDERTAIALERLGYERPFPHTARAVHLAELEQWDVALAMSANHARTLRRTAEQIPDGHRVPRILMWGFFDPTHPVGASEEDVSVPDPWYEGQRSFDRAIKEMSRALPSLVVYLRALAAQ